MERNRLRTVNDEVTTVLDGSVDEVRDLLRRRDEVTRLASAANFKMTRGGVLVSAGREYRFTPEVLRDFMSSLGVQWSFYTTEAARGTASENRICDIINDRISGKKNLVVRDVEDYGIIEGVVSKNAHHVRNSFVFDTFMNRHLKGERRMSRFRLCNGNMSVMLSDPTIRVASQTRLAEVGDIMEYGVELANTHHGTAALHIHNIVWRLVCKNGLTVSKRESGGRVQHKGVELHRRIDMLMDSTNRACRETFDSIEEMRSYGMTIGMAKRWKAAVRGAGINNSLISRMQESAAREATTRPFGRGVDDAVKHLYLDTDSKGEREQWRTPTGIAVRVYDILNGITEQVHYEECEHDKRRIEAVAGGFVDKWKRWLGSDN